MCMLLCAYVGGVYDLCIHNTYKIIIVIVFLKSKMTGVIGCEIDYFIGPRAHLLHTLSTIKRRKAKLSSREMLNQERQAEEIP